MLIEITNERKRTMDNLESQITSLDQRLNLALVEKFKKDIKDIKVAIFDVKVRLYNLENNQDNLSKSEKEWLNGRSKSSKR
jgi:molybdopterin-guanine dinucleotide biosynthesis protein